MSYREGWRPWSWGATRICYLLPLVVAVTVEGVKLWAQVQDGPMAARFEVASVKSVDLGRRDTKTTPGMLSMQHESFLNILAWAYDFDHFRIVAPDWAGSTHYTIEAKPPGPASEKQLRAMLQTLLHERFGLVVHSAKKDASGLVMSVAKDGLRVTPHEVTKPFEYSGSRDAIELRNATFLNIASFLSGGGMNVFDDTGIGGGIDVSLPYKKFLDPSDHSQGALVASWREAAAQSIGLRFQEKRLKVEMIVVDHAERVPIPD